MCRLRLKYIMYVENQPLVLQWFVLFYKGNVWEKKSYAMKNGVHLDCLTTKDCFSYIFLE